MLPRRGVKILLSSSPALATDASSPSVPGVAGGDPITLEGRTVPALPGEVLALHVARDDQSPQALGTVRLNAAGGFSYSGYRPAEPGRYEVWATYTSTRPDLTDDYLCPLAFRLTSPGPPSDRAWVAAERSGRRSVRVRIACPRVAACRGSLRIRRGKLHRYAVVAGRPESVRLTIPRRRRGDGRGPIELSERTPRARTHRIVVR